MLITLNIFHLKYNSMDNEHSVPLDRSSLLWRCVR